MKRTIKTAIVTGVAFVALAAMIPATAAASSVADIAFTGHTEAGDQIWVSWDDVANVEYYQLALRERGEAPFWEQTTGSTTPQIDASQQSFTWKSDTDYILRVVARDTSGNRLARGAYVFQFEGDPSPDPVITAGDEHHSDTTAGELCINWTGTAQDGATGWTIMWREVGNGSWINSVENQVLTDDDYLITGLTSGTDYVVRIELERATGASEKWAVQRFTAP